MRFKNYLIESKNKPLIVVDVQPAYQSYITFHIEELMNFINDRTGNILMFVNAEEMGLTEDTIRSCQKFWIDNGMNEDTLNKIKIFDKGYGYFRSWMDFTNEKTIIKAIRYMYQKRKTDSRDIEPETWEKILGNGWEDSMEDDPLTIEWVSLKLLKKFSGGYICGGGRNECLREVTLLMNAFNLRTKLIDKFIY